VIKQYHIVIKGRVQGVGYRWFARQAAEELGICGYVKNLANGDVEVVAEGETAVVDKFIEYLRQGPSFAHVVDIQVKQKDFIQSFNNFEVSF